MVPKAIWQHLNSLLPSSLQLQTLLMCFSFPRTVRAAQTRYCGSLRLSEPLPSAREPSSRGLDRYFLVAFSQREKKLYYRNWAHFPCCGHCWALAGKLLLWLVSSMGGSNHRSLPETLELKETTFLPAPCCMVFYDLLPAPPYLQQDSYPEFRAVVTLKSCINQCHI